MRTSTYREIPYNFTSADDRLIIRQLFGESVWDDVEELRSQRVTGRSARLLMRFMGDLFILHRNPFLLQELIDSPKRRRYLFKTMLKDLNIIAETAKGHSHDKARMDKVLHLVEACRQQADNLRANLEQAKTRQAAIRKELGAVVGPDNVCMDPFVLISHATDATDWRLYLPIAVVRPSVEAQLPPLLEAIAKLNLHVIPRGGGTGLTGGAVPVAADCVMINTEKLNRIDGIHHLQAQTNDAPDCTVLRLEAGVVTQKAMQYAEERGYVFATDPTSAWASTIGGNIAENAGGKTAVLWGTAIDNIAAYTIAMPGAELLQVRRVNHPLRKILPDDEVVFEVHDQAGELLRTISLRGDEIRKKGLWKDITNKALSGLPGVQKEGTDGIITSAEFVLYKNYPKKLTFCLEFFGDSMDEASRVIVELSDFFVNQGEEALMALEHFDEEYIRAIDYKFKAARSMPPKAVLLIDMVAHTTGQILRGKQNLLNLLEKYPNTEIFVAADSDEAARFWRDRKRLGAIAARTNAFKLNEDIVLPLHTLADFARYIDQYNLDEDQFSQKCVIHEIMDYLSIAEPIEDPDWLEAKMPKAEELCASALDDLAVKDRSAMQQEKAIKTLLSGLTELFRGYPRILASVRRVHDEARKRRIIIATHMHAGDGNVHVNIPVFSNDRVMMRRAEQTAEAVMQKAIDLGGVVSGEHGIGITKIKFLEKERVEALRRYRQEVDPRGLMNPSKLDAADIMDRVFTPSFNLLELEARILQHNSLETLASSIAQCIRCGKCKPDCCVFSPAEALFFHPRNKNLAIGSLIEALLYDMQRSHFPRFHQLKYLEEVADHCTLCGKCLPPCPVNIDTAAISVLERRILTERGYKHTPLPTRMSLAYLKTRNRAFNRLFRTTVVRGGAAAQRFAARLLPKLPARIKQQKWRPLAMLASPMPQPSVKVLRQYLPQTSLNEALLFNPDDFSASGKAVFYFPGCGSERLYSDVAMAALYILIKSGVRVVLPPANLCCGFPARANAKMEMHGDVTLRDTIILSQIRDMLGHLVFDAVVVSCGTCREALHELGVEDIFACKLMDASYFTLEQASLQTERLDERLSYHTPCHDSLQGEGMPVLRRLVQEVSAQPHCCSEAGTLSLSRPDITGAMFRRKQAAIATCPACSPQDTVITNCPSCLTGLGRHGAQGPQPMHLAVYLAERIGGKNWQREAGELFQSAEVIAF